MKRADMVELGRDVIATYCYNHKIEDLTERDYFNLANNILGHFEAEGMLPPFNKFKLNRFNERVEDYSWEE